MEGFVTNSHQPAVCWHGHRAWAEVDLDALAHNAGALRERAGKASLMAVVKANGYGHGAVGVSRALLAAGADRLAVICVDEGEQLRRAGITAPVLVMGYVPLDQVDRVVELSLTPAISSYQFALALAKAAARRSARVPVHIKVDTGLNRYGLPPREAVALGRALATMPGLMLEGLFTHFACADEVDQTYTQQQFRDFLAVAQQLPDVPIRHVANTAALLSLPETALDMVRPGLGLYGCYPSPHLADGLALRPVLSFKSLIVRLTPVAQGQGVSYGLTWRAKRPSLIALVMCGYGDGLPRALSNRGSVLIRSRRAPIVGRVCMDMCMADVTDIPNVAVGDEVVFIGRQGDEVIAAEEVAAVCNTISYEIFCGITARVPRLYLRDGQVVSKETLVEGPPREASMHSPLIMEYNP